jgi:hypothetical protein
LAYWANQYEKRNDPTAENAYNLANDLRWCCVNFNLAPAACVPITSTNLCTTAVTQSELTTAGAFLYKFWFLPVFQLLLVVDFFVITKGIYERALGRYRRETKSAEGEGEDAGGEEEANPEEATAGEPEQTYYQGLPAKPSTAPAGLYKFRATLPGQGPPGQVCFVPAKSERPIGILQQGSRKQGFKGNKR